MDGFPDCPFWEFSVDVYERSGVSPACIGLQTRLGVDVNVLLFCCFAATEGFPPLGEAALKQAVAGIAEWNGEVVQRLRTVRSALKGKFEHAPKAVVAALRDRTLTLETDCEHVEQLILAAQLDGEPATPVPAGERPGVAAANVADYLALIEATPEQADLDDLASILRGCFEDFDETVLVNTIKGEPATTPA